LVPGSQVGGVRAKGALSACSKYTLLLLVRLHILLHGIIVVTRLYGPLGLIGLLSVFRGVTVIRTIKIETVVTGVLRLFLSERNR
jgi:hypothetical protein